MSQLSLSYSPEHAATDAWRLRCEWARRAVDTVGHKHVAYSLDVAPSTLTDALRERDGKCLRGDHLAKIEFLASTEVRAELLTLYTTPHGYELVRKKTRTPEEALRAVLELVARESPVLMRAITKEIG